MLFIIAEKEKLFDNRDNAIKAYDLAKGPKKLENDTGHRALRRVSASAPAMPQALAGLVRSVSERRGSEEGIRTAMLV
jgi:hypothetical protein